MARSHLVCVSFAGKARWQEFCALSVVSILRHPIPLHWERKKSRASLSDIHIMEDDHVG